MDIIKAVSNIVWFRATLSLFHNPPSLRIQFLWIRFKIQGWINHFLNFERLKARHQLTNSIPLYSGIFVFVRQLLTDVFFGYTKTFLKYNSPPFFVLLMHNLSQLKSDVLFEPRFYPSMKNQFWSKDPKKTKWSNSHEKPTRLKGEQN